MGHFYTYCYSQGNNLYSKGYSNGKRFVETIDDYQPYLFVPGGGEYKDVWGNPTQKKYFDTIRHAHDFVKQYDGTKFKIYGLKDFLYVFMNDEFPGAVEYDFNLISTVSIDIEVSSKEGMPNPHEALQEITAITLIKGDNILTLGTRAYTGKHKDSYHMCHNEKSLLLNFLTVWNSDKWAPDVVTGWNIEKFDIPYIINRIKRLFGEAKIKALSPWGFVREKDIIRGKSTANGDEDSRQDSVWEIAGVSQLDYMQLYKRFNPVTRDSYTLNNIAQIELGEKKVDYKSEGYKTLDDLYERNFDLYIDYNIHDALLVQRLEERLGFILLIISIAYKAKINYQDAFTTVKPWDVIIHNYLLDQKIVIPQKIESVERELIGAYCKDPQIGMHNWVVSFDYEGEYPSVLSQCNISPETFVEKIDMYPLEDLLRSESFGEITEYAESKNCCVTANGCLFRKDRRGFIPALVDRYKADRAEVKNKMKDLKKVESKTTEIKNEIIKLDNYQLALKILTNGLYGALSNQYFRWFNIDLAEAVTMTSQLATRYMEVSVNKYLNKILKTNEDYVIAADTDSNYINLERLVSQLPIEGKSTEEVVELIDQICKSKIKSVLELANLQISKWFNSYKQVLKMNQDIIASKAIWTAKKRYIANVWDKEGLRYKDAELMYKGIEVVRSSTPLVCRDRLKDCLKIIMNKDEETLRQFVSKFEREFYKLNAEDIGKPSSVKGIEIYASKQKSIPIHVRGSLNYNYMLRSTGLDKHVPLIKDNDKIKFVYLKIPNPLKDYVISFHEEIPDEWDLDRYIDYDTQWEKVFITPLKTITDVIQWNLSVNENLASFFC